MVKKILTYIILLLSCLGISKSQEIVTGLPSSSAIGNELRVFTKSSPADTLDLPFFDDFSVRSVFPDEKKWSDDYAFVNNTYSDKQISAGIATLDAIDNTGRLYEDASPTGFEADKLTSQPLNLQYLPTDNVRLSFFYQPGGLGDMPEENDSLIVEFFAPAENKWYSVWQSEANRNQHFKAVIISINNTRFLRKGFRFRFINYASLSSNMLDPSLIGNCDHWNIDYVFLDRNRSENDTVFNDVAFTLPLRSLLKTHEAMPWKHFQQVSLQEMGSSVPIHYRNNDIIVRNVTRNFQIWDVYKNKLSKFFSAGAANINPLTDVDYNANLIYTFNSESKDSALFRIKTWLITDDFDRKDNDTLVYYQNFGDYFAFDDGSSEGGYGINGLGSRNAMVAYRFKSYKEDTIRAIRICFNDSYLNSNQRSFDLMIWDNNNGIPGDILYTQEEVMVKQGDDINGFYTYYLRSGVTVKDVFYVGWRQRSETFLNAGLDINSPHEGRQFYCLSGNWFQSQVSGTLMIRPVLGDFLKTGISDIPQRQNKLLSFWPNPATENIEFHQDIPEDPSLFISFIDLQGREIFRTEYRKIIDISHLQEGIYTMVLSKNGKPAGYNRFVKMK